MAKGVIYILTNPSFREYVKIGYADDVKKRVDELNASTAVPYSFQVYATIEVPKRRSDFGIHKLIDMLRPELRSVEKDEVGKVVRKREFFRMEPEMACELLESIADIFGCTVERRSESKLAKEERKVAEVERSKFEQTKQARYAFWEKFFSIANATRAYKDVFQTKQKASTDHWLTLPSGTKLGAISPTINIRHGGVAVEFYIYKSKAFYKKLESHKVEIERELGVRLEWQYLDGKDASRIIVRNNLGDFRKFDDAKRTDACKWLVKTAVAFKRVFPKYY